MRTVLRIFPPNVIGSQLPGWRVRCRRSSSGRSNVFSTGQASEFRRGRTVVRFLKSLVTRLARSTVNSKKEFGRVSPPSHVLFTPTAFSNVPVSHGTPPLRTSSFVLPPPFRPSSLSRAAGCHHKNYISGRGGCSPFC